MASAVKPLIGGITKITISDFVASRPTHDRTSYYLLLTFN